MIDISFEPEMEKAGKKLRVELMALIASGVDPPNAPLTVKKKGHGRTLIDSGDFISNIEVRATKDSVEVGVFRPSIARYVFWNEHGTTRIPPRPIFGPVADGPGERIFDELEADIADKLIAGF